MYIYMLFTSLLNIQMAYFFMNLSSTNPVYIDGLVQERCNSIANTLELCLACTNLSIWDLILVITVPADVLPHSSARPSAATLLTADLERISVLFLRIWMIL